MFEWAETWELRPGKDSSVDEAMVKFKGRLGMKQYMPMKPVKQGIKVWVCAEASSSFVCNFQVYTEKRQDGVVEQNLGYRVVHDLTRDQNFMGNFFSSQPSWEVSTYMIRSVDIILLETSLENGGIKFSGSVWMSA